MTHNQRAQQTESAVRQGAGGLAVRVLKESGELGPIPVLKEST